MAELKDVGVIPGQTVHVGPSKGDGHTIEVSGEHSSAQVEPTILHAVLARAK
jgi:DtxR family Mn-dependent transcriptional regulator